MKSEARNASVVVLAVDLFLIAVAAGGIVFGVPRFVAIYQDFDTVLPVVTEMAIRLSRSGIAMGGLGLLGAMLVAKEFFVAGKVSVWVNIGTMVVLIMFVVFMVVAFWLPMPTLMEGVMVSK